MQEHSRMDPLTTSAASGMRARLESLDLLANNLANAATGGYKLDRESYGLYVSPDAAGQPFPDTLPVIEHQWTDFSQGPLEVTGNPLDLALSGEGFFAVNGPSGPLYTRNGSFRISADGRLVTADQRAVRLAGGGVARVRADRPLNVLPDGTLRQDGQVIGQLELASFPRGTLSKTGANYYQAEASARPAAATASVEQGKLESSNVTAPETAVRLIGVMRQFEMLQRAVSLGSEMNRHAIEEVARVGG